MVLARRAFGNLKETRRNIRNVATRADFQERPVRGKNFSEGSNVMRYVYVQELARHVCTEVAIAQQNAARAAGAIASSPGADKLP